MWNRRVEKSFLRIKVEIDEEKPLMVGFWDLRKEKGKVWAEIKYEKITDFYFRCGRIGHVVRYCEENGDLDVVGERKRRFGLWMEARLVRNIEEWKWNKGGKKERCLG